MSLDVLGRILDMTEVENYDIDAGISTPDSVSRIKDQFGHIVEPAGTQLNQTTFTFRRVCRILSIVLNAIEISLDVQREDKIRLFVCRDAAIRAQD